MGEMLQAISNGKYYNLTLYFGGQKNPEKSDAVTPI